jgi:hypothetical protein
MDNLPAPSNMTKNPTKKKKSFFKDATQKSATLVKWGTAVKMGNCCQIFYQRGRLLKNVLIIFEKNEGCADPN